jgi:hypothetical protein
MTQTPLLFYVIYALFAVFGLACIFAAEFVHALSYRLYSQHPLTKLFKPGVRYIKFCGIVFVLFSGFLFYLSLRGR